MRCASLVGWTGGLGCCAGSAGTSGSSGIPPCIFRSTFIHIFITILKSILHISHSGYLLANGKKREMYTANLNLCKTLAEYKLWKKQVNKNSNKYNALLELEKVLKIRRTCWFFILYVRLEGKSQSIEFIECFQSKSLLFYVLSLIGTEFLDILRKSCPNVFWV